MNYEKVRDQFLTWGEVLKPFIMSEAMDDIFRHIKSRVQQGVKVLPTSKDVFKSLLLTNRHKIKCLVVLQCPYATERNGVVISDGIPLNCENIKPYQQPSMFQWWQALEKTYGFSPDNDLRNDLSYLLREEHVLLLNSALTVEKDKVDSHATLWEPFTRYLLEEVIGKLYSGLPIVLCGTGAQKYEKYINPLKHHILKVEHPAAASYANRDWDYKDMFGWINNIIEANNGPQEKIQWLRRKNQVSRDTEPDIPIWVRETEYGKKVDGIEIDDLPWED